MSEILKIQDLYAGYGKKEVLHGIDFSVNEGEIITIIGANGAGKSTLLKVVAGLIPPKKGHIFFAGEEITSMNCQRRVRKGIVYFIQGGEVFPNLTVAENLEIGQFTNTHSKNGKLREEILSIFPDIKDWLKKRAGLLSGGQRQQVALAMVLLKQPRLLLLDEPSAGLAHKLVSEILARVKQINLQFGTTILLVEQNVREGLKIAHRCAVMSVGKIESLKEEPEKLLTGNKIENMLLGVTNVQF